MTRSHYSSHYSTGEPAKKREVVVMSGAAQSSGTETDRSPTTMDGLLDRFQQLMPRATSNSIGKGQSLDGLCHTFEANMDKFRVHLKSDGRGAEGAGGSGTPMASAIVLIHPGRSGETYSIQFDSSADRASKLEIAHDLGFEEVQHTHYNCNKDKVKDMLERTNTLHVSSSERVPVVAQIKVPPPSNAMWTAAFDRAGIVSIFEDGPPGFSPMAMWNTAVDLPIAAGGFQQKHRQRVTTMRKHYLALKNGSQANTSKDLAAEGARLVDKGKNVEARVKEVALAAQANKQAVVLQTALTGSAEGARGASAQNK